MDDSAYLTGLVIAITCVMTLLPMAPAIGMYKVAPDGSMRAEGILAGLTVKAGGAIATYLVIFAALLWLLRPAIERVLAGGALWTVYGHIELVTSDGKPVQDISMDDLGQHLQLTTEPRLYAATGKSLRITLPREKGRFPALVLNLPDRGAVDVDLQQMKPDELSLDYVAREAILNKPVTMVVTNAASRYEGTGSLKPSTTAPALPPQVPVAALQLGGGGGP